MTHAENGQRATTQAASARRVVLAGGVQGLGVRPAIFRLATQLKLNGTVRNTSRGVEIEIEGHNDALAEFDRELLSSLPQAALVVRLRSETLVPTGRRGFTIVREPATERWPLACRRIVACAPIALARLSPPAIGGVGIHSQVARSAGRGTP